MRTAQGIAKIEAALSNGETARDVLVERGTGFLANVAITRIGIKGYSVNVSRGDIVGVSSFPYAHTEEAVALAIGEAYGQLEQAIEEYDLARVQDEEANREEARQMKREAKRRQAERPNEVNVETNKVLTEGFVRFLMSAIFGSGSLLPEGLTLPAERRPMFDRFAGLPLEVVGQPEANEVIPVALQEQLSQRQLADLRGYIREVNASKQDTPEVEAPAEVINRDGENFRAFCKENCFSYCGDEDCPFCGDATFTRWAASRGLSVAQ